MNTRQDAYVGQRTMPSQDQLRWEMLFETAVTLAASRRLFATVSMLKRLLSWQHRQKDFGATNNKWHDAELLWLEGVALERARRRGRAKTIWLRLAKLYDRQVLPIPYGGDLFLTYPCQQCSTRTLGFADNWYSVALQLRSVSGVEALARSLENHARGTDSAD